MENKIININFLKGFIRDTMKKKTDAYEGEIKKLWDHIYELNDEIRILKKNE
ncbi:MAG: hypothetical protein ACOC3Z_03430 [Nanoarchaeota archaeon]